MLAVAIARPGGPEVLVPERRPTPEPGPDEIRIRVRAAGVNRPDVMQREGRYDPPPGASDLPGLEVAGEVDALGEGAARWSLGDRVTALAPGGGYAEACVVPTSHALPIPAGLDWAEAAAIPETAFTVWHNLVERGRLAAGETCLIHGATSGIGTMAIQIACGLGGVPYATAGSEAKCRAAEALGAERCWNYREADFVEGVAEATGGRGVDLILDMVGGDYVARNIAAAAPDGRIVNIAFQKGAEVTLNLWPAMAKRLTWTGSTLRPQSVEAKARMARGLEETVWPMIADGRVRPVIDSRFPLAEAAEAHRRLDAGEHVGKVVLTV